MEILALLASEDWRQRQAAVDALVQHPDPRLAHALVELVRLKSNNLDILNAALQTLAQTGSIPIQEVMELLTRPQEAEYVRIHAAQLLGMLRNPQALPALLAALEDPSENVRFHTMESLGQFAGSEAVEVITARLKQESPFIQYAAILALAKIGDPRPVPVLRELLSNAYLAEAAVEALGALGGPDVLPDILNWLKSPAGDAGIASGALAAILRRSPEVSSVAVGPAIRERLLAHAQGLLANAPLRPSPYQLADAAVLLGWLFKLDPYDEPVLQALLEMLAHAPACSEAEQVLQSTPGPAQPKVVALLVHVLESDAPADARACAARILGRLGHPEALPTLLRALEADEDNLAAQAAQALEYFKSDQAEEALFDQLSSPSILVRQAACGALSARLALAPTPTALARLPVLLQSPNEHIRLAAVRLFSEMPGAKAQEVAWSALQDPAAAVRRTAVEALARLSHPRLLEGLRLAMEDPDSAVRAAAAQAMAALPGGPDAPLLHQAMHDPDGWVRMYACRATHPSTRAETLPDLLDLLADPLPPVRIAAIEAIARLDNPAAFHQRLSALLQDTDENVRAAARRAIQPR